MKDLDFSAPIELAYNQRGSIVLDVVGTKTDEQGNKIKVPWLVNYGLIKNQDESFSIKSKVVELSNSRNFVAIGSNEEASVALPNECATKKPKIIAEKENSKIFGYTVKSFPYYGAYGFVNYNEGEDSSYQYGTNLNNSRSGGGVFS